MLGSGAQLFTFEFEGPNLRRVHALASKLQDSVFLSTHDASPVLGLPSRAPVPPGIRIELSFATGSGAAIELSGVSRSFMPDARGNYLVEVCIAPTHRHRLAALRAHCRRNPSDVPVDVYREPSGSRAPPPPSLPGSNLPMRLRLRGSDDLLECIRESAHRSDGGTLRIPVRREARVGRRALLEVGLGPMVDEVVLSGVITETRSIGPGRSDALVRIVPSHRHRVTYLAQVLRGQREPTARALPRYEVKLQAHVVRHVRVMPAAIESISGAGVFVRSYVDPEVGSNVDLNIVLPKEGRLHVAADVIWRSKDQDRVGFGARFATGQLDVLGRIRDYLENIAPPLETTCALPV